MLNDPRRAAKSGAGSPLPPPGNERRPLSDLGSPIGGHKQHTIALAGHIGGSQRPADEARAFLAADADQSSRSCRQAARKAALAKQEEAFEDGPRSCAAMCLRLARRHRCLLLAAGLLWALVAAIYGLPYVEVRPQTPARLPHIPFDFESGPLRPSSPQHFKAQHLFQGQLSGAESVALDAAGNMYLAIEGGFVLHGLLNHSQGPQLTKIAELNGVKHLAGQQRRIRSEEPAQAPTWRRECQLDEKIYGPQLYSSAGDQQDARRANFVSNVMISRCSKPLGIRLSPDENYLYVIDTLAGLFRVSLRVPERPHSSQRLVTKLVDFRHNRPQLLPVTQLSELPAGATPDEHAANQSHANNNNSNSNHTGARQLVEVALTAVDDLVVDYGAGTRGGDIVYMSLASQAWQAISFFYDMLEGRPSGAILRYDTGINQLTVLSSARVTHVRTSNLGPDAASGAAAATTAAPLTTNAPALGQAIFMGVGAPNLDENDVFDDRPLHFPNGLELTDDRQALLIADTTNKRIIKHYIRGSRRGASDLWAWTPMYPDNIRRGFDRRVETYWTVGCWEDQRAKFIDLNELLHPRPRVRKFILKSAYLWGWLLESLGAHVLGSKNLRDYGYSFKIGSSILEDMCHGMMILQFNNNGDVIRSIYSKEFPNDLAYYSQVNEVIDPANEEHVLYLSSPGYKYVTKLTLPPYSQPVAGPHRK